MLKLLAKILRSIRKVWIVVKDTMGRLCRVLTGVPEPTVDVEHEEVPDDRAEAEAETDTMPQQTAGPSLAERLQEAAVLRLENRPWEAVLAGAVVEREWLRGLSPGQLWVLARLPIETVAAHVDGSRLDQRLPVVAAPAAWSHPEPSPDPDRSTLPVLRTLALSTTTGGSGSAKPVADLPWVPDDLVKYGRQQTRH